MKTASIVLSILSLAIMAGLSYFVGHHQPSTLALYTTGVIYSFACMLLHHSACNLYAIYEVGGNVWLELLLPHLVGAAVALYAFQY